MLKQKFNLNLRSKCLGFTKSQFIYSKKKFNKIISNQKFSFILFVKSLKVRFFR